MRLSLYSALSLIAIAALTEATKLETVLGEAQAPLVDVMAQKGDSKKLSDCDVKKIVEKEFVKLKEKDTCSDPNNMIEKDAETQA